MGSLTTGRSCFDDAGWPVAVRLGRAPGSGRSRPPRRPAPLARHPQPRDPARRPAHRGRERPRVQRRLSSTCSGDGEVACDSRFKRPSRRFQTTSTSSFRRAHRHCRVPAGRGARRRRGRDRVPPGRRRRHAARRSACTPQRMPLAISNTFRVEVSTLVEAIEDGGSRRHLRHGSPAVRGSGAEGSARSRTRGRWGRPHRPETTTAQSRAAGRTTTSTGAPGAAGGPAAGATGGRTPTRRRRSRRRRRWRSSGCRCPPAPTTRSCRSG